jgi:hypothetical protein
MRTGHHDYLIPLGDAFRLSGATEIRGRFADARRWHNEKKKSKERRKEINTPLLAYEIKLRGGGDSITVIKPVSLL